MSIEKINFPGQSQVVTALMMGYQNPGSLAQQAAVTKYGWVPVSLPSCSTFILPPGDFACNLGIYSVLQVWDSNAQYWRIVATGPAIEFVSSDGNNFRLANLTSSPIGGVITNSGSGYTSAPTCAPNAGGATFRCVLGSALNTSVTITAGGSGYTLPPLLLIDPPPAGGVQATAYCTISGGVVNGVTVTNQGAGYTSVPSITVINQPGDTAGTGCVLTAARITNAGTAGAPDTVCAILPVTPGTAVTSVPSLAFSGGGGSNAAATAIMLCTCTTCTGASPSHMGNGNFALIGSALTAGSATLTNPAISTGAFVPRFGMTAYSTTATPTTTTILDGGLHQASPTGVWVYNSDGTISVANTPTMAFGGVADTSFLQPL